MPSAKPVARPTVPPTRPPIGPPTAWPSAAPRLTLRETGSCANATAGTMEIAVTRTAAIRSFMGSSRCENRFAGQQLSRPPLVPVPEAGHVWEPLTLTALARFDTVSRHDHLHPASGPGAEG